MHWRWPCRLLVFMLAPITIHAEDGSAAGLRYAPVSNVQEYQGLPTRILVVGNSPIERSAASELERGLSGMLGRRFADGVSANFTTSSRWEILRECDNRPTARSIP